MTGPAETNPTAVARPVGGQDCSQISQQTFAQPGPDQQWSGSSWRSIGPDNVNDQYLSWFYEPRSISEALMMAFGTQWRVDALPSTSIGCRMTFLLTDREFGWRLLTNVRPRGQGWCTDIDIARGALSPEHPERNTALAGIRRDWLSAEVAITTGFTTLKEALSNRERRTAMTSIGPEEMAYARVVRDALIEVWLAEQGYTGADAQAVRTMIALGGLSALNSYDRTPARSRRNRSRTISA